MAGQSHCIPSVCIENLSQFNLDFAQQFATVLITRLHNLHSLSLRECHYYSRIKKQYLDVMLRAVMDNPHATLTTLTCPQLTLASPGVVRSFFFAGSQTSSV